MYNSSYCYELRTAKSGITNQQKSLRIVKQKPINPVVYNYYLLLILSLFLSACSGPIVKETQSDWHVSTQSGLAQGISTREGVVSWINIPYALPPINGLRWRAPREYLDRSGQLISSDESMKICPQKADPTANLEGDSVVGDEDCLYLDIRAPKTFLNNRKIPVMVWIHGGGNTTGHKGAYNFSKFVAAQNVIVVTINYRLGPLGWFTHPLIQSYQAGLDATSNFGTLDMIEALKWINNNIEQFGGDAENITVFGESAGGHNVYTLLASPLSEGLFQKAISQSGYVELASLKEAYNEGSRFKYVTRSSEELLKAFKTNLEGNRLRDLKASDIIETYNDLPIVGAHPLTTADGVVLPEDNLLDTLSKSSFAKNVSVMAGATRDEVTLWLGLSRYFVDVRYPFTRLGPPVIKAKDPKLYKLWVKTRSHAWKLHGVDEPLSALEQAGNESLFAFRLDWDDQRRFPLNFPEIFGAAHGVDISFVTGDYYYGPATSYIYPNTDKRMELEVQVMNAWANFARTGKPDNDQNAWPSFSSSVPIFMRLDTKSERGLSIEETSPSDLMQIVADSSILTPIQKCLLVWDTLTNVRQPDYDFYLSWNNEACREINALQHKQQIEDAIVEEFGSTDVF